MRHLVRALVVLCVILSCSLALAKDAGPDVEPGATASPGQPESPPDTGEVAAPEDEAGALKQLYTAIVGGDWKHAVALLLIIMGMVLRRTRVQKALPRWFKGDRGGVVLIFVMSFVGSLGLAGLAGVGFGDLDAWKTAALVAIEAIGGYVGAKRFIWPKDGAETAEATPA